MPKRLRWSEIGYVNNPGEFVRDGVTIVVTAANLNLWREQPDRPLRIVGVKAGSGRRYVLEAVDDVPPSELAP